MQHRVESVDKTQTERGEEGSVDRLRLGENELGRRPGWAGQWVDQVGYSGVGEPGLTSAKEARGENRGGWGGLAWTLWAWANCGHWGAWAI